MKNLFKIIIIICVFKLQAQEGVIVPFGTISTDVENGTYIKDTNASFLPFVGTYHGNWDNKQVTFTFQKMEHVTFSHPNGNYYYRDMMVGTYTIVNIADGSVLYSDMDALEFQNFPISSMGGVYNGELEFNFFDKPERCQRGMQFQLYKMITSAGITTVRYWGRDSASYAYDCTNPEAFLTPIMPLGFLTLTKVN